MITTIERQVALFTGCVYLMAKGKVRLPDGYEANRARFNVEYGGRTFALEADGKRTTNSAWTAFLRGGVRPPIA